MTAKIILIPIIISIIGQKSFCQSYDKKPISIQDIDKGLNDFNYFRPILLENKFELQNKDDQTENWRVYVDKNEYLCQVCIQVSSWKNEGKEFGRLIMVQVRKDLLPKYSSEFTDSVLQYYNEKKAVPIKTATDNNEFKDNYKLIYFRKDSKVEAQISESELWVKCEFRLSFL